MRDFWSEPNHDTSADDLLCRRAILVEGESDRAALAVDAVEEIIKSQGELPSLRRLQKLAAPARAVR